MKTKKHFGQNFLMDEDAAKELVDAAAVTKAEVVLEIGPGLGYVTREIALQAKKVVALEIDRDLITPLRENVKDLENVEIINGDGLDFLRTLEPTNPWSISKFISSLPFQITSPVLQWLAYKKDFIKTASLIIQKEVAERITAQVPNSNYMATFLQTFFEITLVRVVERIAFDPVPEVDAAIIKLVAKKSAPIATQEIAKYSKFLHHGFLQKRKMLNKRFDPELLEKFAIDPTRRAETLTETEWLKLFGS